MKASTVFKLLLAAVFIFMSFTVIQALLTEIVINTPVNGTNISGTYTLNASVTTWAYNVTFYNSSDLVTWTEIATVQNESSAQSDFNYSWDTTGIDDSNVYINATVDNSTEAEIISIVHSGIEIDNTAPSIHIDYPHNNSNISGITIINGTISNDVRNVTISFYNGTWIDLVVDSTVEGDTNFSYSWNTSNTTDSTNITINATAFDNVGLSSAAPATNIEIGLDNTPPNVTLNTPTTAWYTANFTVNVTFSEIGAGINTVKYRTENATANSSWTVMTISGTEANATFDITSVSDGNYTVRINATDMANTSNDTITITNVGVDDTLPVIYAHSCTPSSVRVGKVTTCICGASDTVTSVPVLSYTQTPSTAVSGTFTVYCNATDDAGNSALDGTEYTVTKVSGDSSAGSSSGSAAPAATSEAITTFDSISAGETQEIDVDDSNIAITDLDFSLENDIKEATQISIESRGTSNPTSKYVADDAVYQYIEISKSDLLDIDTAEITFTVERSWVEDKNLDYMSIALWRFDGSDWKKLTTHYAGATSVEYKYTAKTVDFSYFAIAGKTESASEATQTTTTAAADGGVAEEFAPTLSEQIKGTDIASIQVGAVFMLVVVIMGIVIAMSNKHSYFGYKKKKKG